MSDREVEAEEIARYQAFYERECGKMLSPEEAKEAIHRLDDYCALALRILGRREREEGEEDKGACEYGTEEEL
jgi:hypothetical protein